MNRQVSLELNVNDVNTANKYTEDGTENNELQEDDNNDDNGDEVYKEWSDIPSTYHATLFLLLTQPKQWLPSCYNL